MYLILSSRSLHPYLLCLYTFHIYYNNYCNAFRIHVLYIETIYQPFFIAKLQIAITHDHCYMYPCMIPMDIQNSMHYFIKKMIADAVYLWATT